MIPPRNAEGRTVWVTRARPKVDRIACPWLIRRFVDPDAVFLFVAPSEVAGVAERFGATPFDVEGVFWSHRGELCTFDVMVEEFGLASIDPLKQLAVIVRGADTARPDIAPQAAGLLAVSLGLSRMYSDDLEQLEAGMPLYDALYRWCRDAIDETHDWVSHTPKPTGAGDEPRSRDGAATLLLSRRDDRGADGSGRLAGGRRGRLSRPPPTGRRTRRRRWRSRGRAAPSTPRARACSLDRLYVALKLNGNFPGNPDRLGLPTIQGAILLCDGETGSLLAVMDSIEVTLRRTAAATALAAQVSRAPGIATHPHLRLRRAGRGAARGASRRAAADARIRLGPGSAQGAPPLPKRARGAGIAMSAVTDLAAAARASDVIVTCTTARSPFLERVDGRARHVRRRGRRRQPGQERDRSPTLMAKALVVADVLDQCAEMGDLRHAIDAGRDEPRRRPCRTRRAGRRPQAGPDQRGSDHLVRFDRDRASGRGGGGA